ncbi:hypothetical protein ABIA39_008499 [Nocardia sp. GAS34]|uniref:hypothetical protein n=1 Tax=unclassified Nocardia TaxID=2637762 RepID=UPI003D248BAF
MAMKAALSDSDEKQRKSMVLIGKLLQTVMRFALKFVGNVALIVVAATILLLLDHAYRHITHCAPQRIWCFITDTPAASEHSADFSLLLPFDSYVGL